MTKAQRRNKNFKKNPEARIENSEVFFFTSDYWLLTSNSGSQVFG
ncbi:MAG TPA: hypothetical protein VNN20_11915 [Thermodesulfobacteriota bacterium]|nr:hypothetical protein [Thermodesulfobacteriota bacterium]